MEPCCDPLLGPVARSPREIRKKKWASVGFRVGVVGFWLPKQQKCQGQQLNHSYMMGVSKYRGTPKSCILIGISIINHPFWGTPIFGNTHIWCRVPCCHPPPPPHGMGPPPPPPIPHTFCTRHCSETYISILLHARRCSETHIFILLDEPSRRIRWVDRAKLWRNANFKLQELLRAVYRTLQCSANGIIYIYISMYIHIHKHQ